MLHTFRVFHDYEAVASHSEFAKRRKMDPEREMLEYKRFGSTLSRFFSLEGVKIDCALARGCAGVIVSLETSEPVFKVQMALAKVLVEQNSAVAGLFLNFLEE